MNGHATEAETRRIEALELKRAQHRLTHDEQLELALLLLEPLHDGFRSIELLDELLKAESFDAVAAVWFAYCCIYELMDAESLKKAAELCERVEKESKDLRMKAAAHMLRADALRQLSQSETGEAELKQSVALAPDWVTNLQFLATVEMAKGDRLSARDHLKTAIENARQFQAPRDVASSMFVSLITGRGSYKIIDHL